jgi:hypothetical protein
MSSLWRDVETGFSDDQALRSYSVFQSCMLWRIDRVAPASHRDDGASFQRSFMRRHINAQSQPWINDILSGAKLTS